MDLVPAYGGMPGLFASILAAVTDAALRGDWGLLKACVSPVCQFAFVDRTRNHSGRYCTPACGSRMTMQAHPRRQSGANS